MNQMMEIFIRWYLKEIEIVERRYNEDDEAGGRFYQGNGRS